MAVSTKAAIGENSEHEVELELVNRVRAGEREAFDRLYESYFNRVYGFTNRRVRDSHDTEEIVQEIFTTAFTAIHGYRGEAPFGAWLFGLARRVIAARFRRREQPLLPLGAAEPSSVDFSLGTQGQSEDPHEAYEFDERIRRMQAVANDHLTQEQWELFSLHHLGRYSVRDLAKRFSKSEQAVKSHLYRVRRALLTR